MLTYKLGIAAEEILVTQENRAFRWRQLRCKEEVLEALQKFHDNVQELVPRPDYAIIKQIEDKYQTNAAMVAALRQALYAFGNQ